MAKKCSSKYDPVEEIIKELRKYYHGTKRIKAGTHLGDECHRND